LSDVRGTAVADLGVSEDREEKKILRTSLREKRKGATTSG